MTVFIAKMRQDSTLDFLSVFNEARWRDFCKKNLGRTIRLELPEPKRTMSQHRYYWAYLEIVGAETGNEPEDLHIFFKQKLLPRRYIKIVGKQETHEIEDFKSTQNLTKAEFSSYLDRISAITEVPLPSPELLGYFK